MFQKPLPQFHNNLSYEGSYTLDQLINTTCFVNPNWQKAITINTLY
jgi:hypothetical protein